MKRRTIDGIHFLLLKGTSSERARAHGQLLKNEIQEGALPALAHKNEWLIRRGPGIIKYTPVQNFILLLYKKLLAPHMVRRIPQDVKDMLQGMSDATGLPYTEVCESLNQPDGLMFLSRFSVMKYVLSDLPHGGLPACSSAVALKEHTKNGRMLVCRNQDYPVVGPWEKHPTVAFHETMDSGDIPHVTVTTAGVHTGGLTTINREGLTLSLHAHFGRKVAIQGTSAVVIGSEISRKAKTIGQAVDLAKKIRPYANWAFVVSSSKENNAAVIEMSPNKTCVHEANDGILIHSNYFHTKELQAEEALIAGGCIEDLVGRVSRLRTLLEARRGKLEPIHFIKALGDHVDPWTGEERVFGNTVSVVTTIKSVVFEPETQRMWISNRHESPVGLGDFLEISLDRFWNENTSDEEFVRIPGYQPSNPALVEGVRNYREAYRAWHMNCHETDYAEKTLTELRKAVRSFPQDGNLWFQTGAVAFYLNKIEEAANYFKQAYSRKLSTHTRGVCRLYLARCHDLLGQRETALDFYQDDKDVTEPRLRRAFRRGKKRPFKQNQTQLMMIDLQFPDPLQY